MPAQPWKSGASAVQFHDILYKTFRDILYTRPAGECESKVEIKIKSKVKGSGRECRVHTIKTKNKVNGSGRGRPLYTGANYESAVRG